VRPGSRPVMLAVLKRLFGFEEPYLGCLSNVEIDQLD
jgi:hypothetical protein